MNKKITTRTGIITSLLILSFIIFMSTLHLPANSATLAAQHEGSQQQNKSQLPRVKSQVQLPNEGNWVPSRETLTGLAKAAAGGDAEELLWA